MSKEQVKLFELLKEFDALCREVGVQYFLTGETLKYALEKESIGPNAAYASVLMTGDNCRAFIDAFEQKGLSDRELDYWGNNPTYPDFTLRYVASDTTAFDMLDYLNAVNFAKVAPSYIDSKTMDMMTEWMKVIQSIRNFNKEEQPTT